MELLFENPFIIIILLGIISSLFKKRKDDNPKRQSHRPQPANPQLEQKVEPPVYSKESADAAQARQEQANKPLQKGYELKKKQENVSMGELQMQQRMLERQAKLVKSAADEYIKIANTAAPEKSANSTIGSKIEGKQRLIEGIIWSEILGPPRAKRPYRQNKGK